MCGGCNLGFADVVPMPNAFRTLITTQFVSSVADNALLIVTIALLQQRGEAAWWVPMLKVMFLSTYVLTAPALGALADRIPKARLMAWMNALKIAGVAAMLLGLHPLLAFLVVGTGSAAYAPAKYGLVTELVPPSGLVRANAWLESSVVGAVLLGTVLGGALSGPLVIDATWARACREALPSDFAASHGDLAVSMLVIVGVYGMAQLLNLGVPDSGARYARRPWHPLSLLRDFRQANRTLWIDPLGGLSLLVTVITWATGAVLQLAVLRWAVDVFGWGLDRGAYLQATVAIGIAAGAWCAARWINLRHVPRLVPLGVVLGALVLVGSSVTTPSAAWPVMALVGAVGGVLIVPMNALLQHRGHQLLTAGRSVAVQGFNENLGILVTMGLYAGLLAQGVSAVHVLQGLGAALLLGMGAISLQTRRVFATP